MTDLPGTFIVLEGADGSGTTSQATYLSDRLRSEGHSVVKTCQPSPGGELGQIIRRHLRATDSPVDPKVLVLLFAADRLDHLAMTIEPALAEGSIVICDRYVFSSWVYQSLKCDVAWVEQLNKYARWPDLTIILQVPVDVAQERLRERAKAQGASPEIYDDLATQERVVAAYEAIVDQGHMGIIDNVHGIDGARPFAEVCNVTYAACKAVIALSGRVR